MTTVTLYKTTPIDFEALKLEFSTTMIAEMILPIARFFEDNRIRLKSIETEGLKVKIQWYVGLSIVSETLDTDCYLVKIDESFKIIKEEDLSKNMLSEDIPESLREF